MTHPADCAVFDGGLCCCGAQPSLFDAVSGHTTAPADGPETSQAAAYMNPGRRGSQRHRIAKVYAEADHPMCWDEAAKAADIPLQSNPTSRVTQLHQGGLIEVVGEGRTFLGSRARLYQITDAGRKALADYAD